jgi:hypothetical protein
VIRFVKNWHRLISTKGLAMAGLFTSATALRLRIWTPHALQWACQLAAVLATFGLHKLSAESVRCVRQSLRLLALSAMSLLSLCFAPSAMAGSLLNVSVTASNYNVGATASYTFTYKTDMSMTDRDSVIAVTFPSGFTLPANSCANVTVTVNGVNKPCNASRTVVSTISVDINVAVAAGSTVVVKISNITNPPTALDYSFYLTTLLDGTKVLDSAQSWPFVILVGPPTVTAISPSSGPTAGGTSVTITGTTLTSASAVKIGGAACTALSANTATSITCTTPAGTAGAASVLVTTSLGTNAANTLYTYIPPPTITAISPASGPTAGRSAVTITGTNLTGASAVTIGGAACTALRPKPPDTDTSMTCMTPTGGAGPASVRVTTPNGTNAANTLYTFVAAPTVTAISPIKGPTVGGTSVTITGTRFTGATGVTIGSAGINWASAPTYFSVGANSWASVTYGNGLFVAVGSNAYTWGGRDAWKYCFNDPWTVGWNC